MGENTQIPFTQFVFVLSLLGTKLFVNQTWKTTNIISFSFVRSQKVDVYIYVLLWP